MASILQIGDKWRAQIRGKLAAKVGRKSIAETFDTKKEAESWGRRTEAELEAMGTVKSTRGDDMTVGEVIAEYRRIRDELGRPIDPTSNTHYMLNHLDEDIGADRISDLTPKRLVAWARSRQEQGAGGYTINMELSQLGTMLRHVASFLQVQFPDVVGMARPLLNYAQLISGGGRRTRTPTEDELASLLVWIDARDRIVGDAVRVAAITGLRRSELARIAKTDVDEVKKAVLVRQRKHPRKTMATDEWVPLLGEAWTIVKRQPSWDVPNDVDDRIFPVSKEKLTDSVTEGTRALGIPDLHLHDMRRKATTELRRMGFDRPARKAITGHKSDDVHDDHYVVVSLDELHNQYDAAQGKKPRQQRPQ